MEAMYKEKYKLGRNVDFAAITSDGRTPDAVCYSAGFKEEGGLACATHYEGTKNDVASILGSMTKQFILCIKERDGIEAAFYYMHTIREIICGAMSEEEMKEATRMMMARKLKEAVDLGIVDEDEIEDILREMDEEEED